MPTRPQDHKAKRDLRAPFPFIDGDGNECFLPPMRFGLFRKHRGLINNEQEMLMAIVEDVADEETLAALDTVPLAEAIKVLTEWAMPGEQDGSSS